MGVHNFFIGDSGPDVIKSAFLWGGGGGGGGAPPPPPPFSKGKRPVDEVIKLGCLLSEKINRFQKITISKVGCK